MKYTHPEKIKIISLLLLGAILFGFTACNDNDNDNDNDGKRVTKIASEFGPFTREFTYSRGELWRYVSYFSYNKNDRTADQAVTRLDDRVVLKGLFHGGNCEQTYVLDSRGLATSCTITSDEGWTHNYTFQYANNFLIGMSYDYESNWNGGSRTESEIYTFTYSNGNMTEVSGKSSSGFNGDNISKTFSYYDDLNTGNLMNVFFEEDYYLERRFSAHIAAFHMGILGRASRNLPKSDGVLTFVYHFDDDNYVNGAISSRGKEVIYLYQ